MVNSSIEELFNSIENSTLYKRYKKMSDILSKDSSIKEMLDEIKMLEQEATYDANLNTSTSYPDLTSYITNENGIITQPINAEVGIVSILKDKMEEEKVRALALLLCATMGINPYMS